MFKKIAILFLALTLLAVPAFASSPWTSEADYMGQAKGKLIFGVKNVLLGWTEIITETGDADNKLVGLGVGVWNGVVYTVGGALHAVTFPLTMVDVPLPDNGVFA